MTRIALALTAGAIMMLVGCTAPADYVSESRQVSEVAPASAATLARTPTRSGWGTRIIVDPETGCHYFFHRDYRSGGMTLRVNQDGTPYCPVEQPTR
jgi:hypothetical protein